MVIMRMVYLLVAPLLCFFIYSCSPVKDKKIVIGFSQCTGTAKWRTVMLEQMKRELTFHPGA